MAAVAIGSAVVPVVAIQAPGGAAVDAPTQARKAETFWCSGTFTVIATRTFGPSEWKQQLGSRPDGSRAVRVFHPSGRVDRFRFNNREKDGSVWTTSATSGTDACISFNGGGLAAAQPEADNGFGWKTGYWQG